MRATTEDEYVDALNKSYASGVIKQLDVYSHGSDNSVNLGGPVGGPAEPGPGAPGHDRGKADYRMLSAWGSEWNPNGNAEVSRINASNFADNATINLWGCNLGGADRGSLSTGASHAQYLANHLGRSVTVNAFNSSGSEFKQRSGVNIYDGTMIRSADARTQLYGKRYLDQDLKNYKE